MKALGLAAMLLAANAFSDNAGDSLYRLELQLIDQNGDIQALDLYRGHPVLITMFYGSCPNVCPLIFEGLRATEDALPDAARNDVRVLMVSMDPERDTPATLSNLARKRHADPKRWTLASVSERDVRTLAATLGVQYRKLPNGEFNHTSIISLLSPDGRLVKQTSILSHADPELITEMTRSQRRTPDRVEARTPLADE
jgi:protein SCO1/2